MAKPKLILHIGFSKCGSTALQRFMLRAQKILRQQGVVLVDQNLNHPGTKQSKAVAQLNLGKLLHAPNAKLSITSSLKKVAEDMDLHSDQVALLSSESLSDSHNYPEMFIDLVSVFDMQVVAYVRPQEDFLPSFWKQSGLPNGVPLEEFIDIRMKHMDPNYLRRLLAWEDLVGRGNVSVNVLKAETLKGGNLIADFCNTLGLPVELFGALANKTGANPSFDHHILSILAQAPHVFEGHKVGKLFNYFESALPEAAFKYGRNPLTQAKREEIHINYEKQNRILIKHFMPHLSYESVFGKHAAARDKDVSDELLEATTHALTYAFFLMQQQNQSVIQLRKRLQELEKTVQKLHN